jgi:hypothetical protein
MVIIGLQILYDANGNRTSHSHHADETMIKFPRRDIGALKSLLGEVIICFIHLLYIVHVLYLYILNIIIVVLILTKTLYLFFV